jgi:hypothetical protein
VLDVPVPEIMLHRARVLPVISELVPARMTQHVPMHRKRKLRALSCPRDHLAVKRLGLLHELVPKAVRVAVLVNPANAMVPPSPEGGGRTVTVKYRRKGKGNEAR